MSTLRSVVKNSAALAAGRIATKALSLVFLGYVTREMGEAGFGRFSMAMALVGFVEVIPGYVARPFIIRFVARERERSGRFLSGVLTTNIVLTLLLCAGLFGAVPFFGYPADVELAIHLLAASLLFSSVTNSYHAVFAGFERMELISIADVANTVLTIALGIGAIAAGGGVVALCGAYALARVATFFLARHWARGLLVDRRFEWPDRDLIRTLLTGSWPFFITTMFVIFYNRADIVMLSWMRGPVDTELAVGRYNAAYKLMEALGLVTSAFVMAVYPVMARRFVHGGAGVLDAFRPSFRALVAFTLPVAVGTSLLAHDLMALLFGDAFAVAGAALVVLIWGQVLDSVNPLAAVALRAVEREGELAKITLVGAAINVGLNLYLIPRHSYMGAAAATLASFAVVWAWSVVSLRRALGPLRVGVDAARGVFAAGAMGIAVWFARPYGLVAAIATGVVVYVPAAIAVGLIRRADLALIRKSA
ncbi:MAG: oligosaccharide flippase family protein [Deltaproteobacteria bacterium]|nr:oligosaccharide flippase family protein [Deltaproteobacteria bacterium]